jgi:hypothetical protein
MQDSHYLVPTQAQGLHKDLEHTLTADTIEEAEDLFVDAKERLLDVNNWKKYSRQPLLDFSLADRQGHLLKRRARKGDRIRIGLPGNGVMNANESDWVVIEAIEYDDYPDIDMETLALRLRPADLAQYDEDNVRDATSTIVIERRHSKLLLSYHGRNEEHEEDNFPDSDRAWLGLSDEQWSTMIAGFLEP